MKSIKYVVIYERKRGVTASCMVEGFTHPWGRTNMRRVCRLVTGKIYHVMNKSIDGMEIFNSEADYLRFKKLIRFFSVKGIGVNFSQFLRTKEAKRDGFDAAFAEISDGKSACVQLIAYCLMPTHIHFALRQIDEDGVSV